MRRCLLPIRATLSCALLLGAAGALLGCEGEDKDGQRVVDSLIGLNDAVTNAIDAAPADWITNLASGEEIDGQLDGATVRGWRLSRSEIAATGFHQVYAEKYFIQLNDYQAGGLRLTGSVVVTRSNIDFGRSASLIDDAVRRSVTAAELAVTGAGLPNYSLEVHTQSVATTAWACGDVNGDPYGNGYCY